MNSAAIRRPIPEILEAAEAAALIADSSRLAISGFATACLPGALLEALVVRHQRSGSPTNLTVYHAAGHGPDSGYDLLAREGLLGKVVGGHWGIMKNLRHRMMENQIEAHNWPQGIIVQAFREMARGTKWGLTSTVGLGTFIDPRGLGGCMNEKARQAGSMIRLEIAPDGSEILRYAPLPIDFSMIRGWRADALGNVSLDMEPLSVSQLDLALAARANGGKVICQVRCHEANRQFPVNEITIPAFLIDYLVVADDPSRNHRQCEGYDEDPSLIGGTGHLPNIQLPRVPSGVRGWIGRRAAREIRPGEVFNLGIGIPGESVAAALDESGRLSEATPTLESGIIGGVGIGHVNFGVAISPQSRIDQGAMFDFYHGGGLDISVMGAAEIGANGDINVSYFGGLATGCGGFIDITQNARRIVFCSTLTAGSLDIQWDGGRLVVRQEGKHRKFVRTVQQVTFSAQQARQKGTDVMVVTERCVLKLDDKGWIVVEIAPGIDMQRDVLDQMDFNPRISPELKLMDSACFGNS